MYAADPVSALPDPAMKPEFYDGVGTKRLIAWGLDVLLVLILATLVFVITIVPLALTVFGIFLLPAIMGMIGFFYRWITLSSGSATWGMRMMSIQLREADGGRLSTSTAFFHTVGYMLSFAVTIVQIASVVMMATSERGQGLSDMVLGTAMINRPAGGW